MGQIFSSYASEDKAFARTLADAFEALLGAIHLDGGMNASRDVIGRVMAPTLAAALRGEIRCDGFACRHRRGHRHRRRLRR